MKYKSEQATFTQPRPSADEISTDDLIEILIKEYDARAAGAHRPGGDFTPEEQERLRADRERFVAAVRSKPELTRRIMLDFLRNEGIIE